MALVAISVFGIGLWSHYRLWKKGTWNHAIFFSSSSIKRMLIDSLLGIRIFRGDMEAGAMHLLISWGFFLLFLGTLALSIHHYGHSFLTGKTYLGFSLIMEVAGVMLIAGLIWALWRRYAVRVPRLERRAEDLLVLVWLLLVAISGYMVEGARLLALAPEWAVWSFGGNSLEFLFKSPESAIGIYPSIWWAHATMSLGLVAVIPYTKLFHVVAAPLSIYLQNSPSKGNETLEEGEGFELKDIVFFDACMRCGRCVENCPSTNAGEPFSPRDLVQALKQRLWGETSPFPWNRSESLEPIFKSLPIWYCTTCRACLEVCPVYGPTYDVVCSQRALAVEDGTFVPPLMVQTLEKLYKYKNPWESSKKKRASWAKELEVPEITKANEELDICYFVGCTTSFDTRAQEIAKAFCAILDHLGVNHAILGKREPCCGDIARVVGEQGLFEEQRQECLDAFEKDGVNKLVVSSPHCFHTFKNHYPSASFTPLHYTQYLLKLLEEGKLEIRGEFPAIVTFHDPCYLGRHNRIFDAPRQLLGAIPGVELREMTHHGPDSLCCGGGGGRMWQEELEASPVSSSRRERMSEIRIREAADTGASVVVTACPLCLIMLEDARKTAGLEEILELLDLNEVLVRALKLESQG